mmetsp:Transcript_4522/g.16766  ORF Transcript_4522/g.16766 Transcript_4522/m.16766 type:complete len:270 (-) Transcript_4522:171-980(-)
MCRSARTPAARSLFDSRGIAMSSITYAGAISRRVKSMVSWSSLLKLRPASAIKIDDAMSRSSHPSPTLGGVAVKALCDSSQCASAAERVMSRRATRDRAAAKHSGAYSITLSCSPASCIKARAPPSCDAGTGVSRPFFKSNSCSARSSGSEITCAAASTKSARAARQLLLNPSTSSRWMTLVYAASMLAGEARAGDKFRTEKKLMGTFTVGSSFQSVSPADSATTAGRAGLGGARIGPRNARASATGVAKRELKTEDAAAPETRARSPK